VAVVKPPRLVVAVVIDQFGSYALDKYLPHLSEDGAIRRGIARGVYVERVAYPYASTNTAPGHAAIHTGATPRVSGVTSNSAFDPKTGKHRAFVADGKHMVIGRPKASASPSVLRVDTVGDALEKATDDRALVVSLAGKDRAAVISGGRLGDLAVWYDYKIPAFTSSTYYGERLPPWLDSWLAANPLDALLAPWEASDPALLARAAGKDDGLGEEQWYGFGIKFPHEPAKAERPYSVLRATPQLTDYMLRLARETVEQMDLGADEVVDLLALSISATDYAGHTFGPDSWEYFDNLLRADRALAELLDWLEKRGPVAVLITSDHGVARLPKQAGPDAGRNYPDEIEKLAKTAAREVLGKGRWVRGFNRPFIYLDPELSGERRARVVAAIQKRLEAERGIAMAADVHQARGWADDPDMLKRSVGLSLAEGIPGDLYVLPARGWVIDESRPRGAGTTHGTPYDFDREVPVIFWGPGVSPHREAGPLPQARVAPTLAALLGVPPPEHVSAEPLVGAPKK
jgi:arylsulfatase A-like enzyme